MLSLFFAFILASVALEKVDLKQNVHCGGPSTDSMLALLSFFLSFFMSLFHMLMCQWIRMF